MTREGAPLELRHWRAFATAAETLHFGLAAEQLGISQSALSQLVKALEAHLGTRLFDRAHRQVRLTEAGRQLLPEARGLVSQSQRAEQAGLVAGRSSTRRLALGYVGSAVVHTHFISLVSRLAAFDPPIVLRLDQCSVTLQAQQIAERILDIGILRSPIPATDPAIAFLPLARDNMVAALHRDHPLAGRRDALDLVRLGEEPFIEFRRQNSGGLNLLTRQACQAAGFEPRVVQTVPQIATMLCLVGAGLGVALVPASSRRLAVPDVVYRELSDPIEADLMMMYRRSDTSPALRDALAQARRIDK